MAGAATFGVGSLIAGGLPAFAQAEQSTQPQPANLPLHRKIPGSEKSLPTIGLGSWITFNVGHDPVLLQNCTDVMAAFFAAGGQMIDSSPMYGSSQATIGHGLAALEVERSTVFAADKLWTSDETGGAAQIAETAQNWGLRQFDLLQVHNMLDWENQFPVLQGMKAQGALDYVGITTSHGRRHELMAVIMQREPLDFIQVTYNPLDRDVENRILPIAQDRNIAVIINRPFQGGQLTRALRNAPLPGIAQDYGAQSWAQLILKYIVSHPAVTCAIPATTRVDHVRENMAAISPISDEMNTRLPEGKERHAIANAIGDAL
ncbi:aldo/keto reductase [Thalassospira marina]|uniref:Aldo/keto reductase n=2 Tax=Thalassospira marina TaxID=2048283 RepID=A0A2N3L066_9PROT|nr:aldo/keto reductase [Thalassospira marina]PKR56214.1 aldo/keto reductase [Thalassospira marina]